MTLKNIIKSNRYDITSDIIWVVIYKINRSWHYAAFCKKSGSYEDGLIFDNDDLDEMLKIAKTDSKAICINGAINGFSSDFTLSEIENKIRTMYELRYCQLYGDFLGSIVPLPQ